MLGTGSDSKLLRDGVGGVTGWASGEAGAPVRRASFSATRAGVKAGLAGWLPHSCRAQKKRRER